MVSPTKAAAAVSSAAGAVAAVGSGTVWLKGHVPGAVVYTIAVSVTALATATTGWLAFRSLKGHYKLRHWWLYVGTEATLMAAIWTAVSWRASATTTQYVMAYVYVALFAIPIVALLYQLDSVNHKECPMCCERIKARARICRYCGSTLRAT